MSFRLTFLKLISITDTEWTRSGSNNPDSLPEFKDITEDCEEIERTARVGNLWENGGQVWIFTFFLLIFVDFPLKSFRLPFEVVVEYINVLKITVMIKVLMKKIYS